MIIFAKIQSSLKIWGNYKYARFFEFVNLMLVMKPKTMMHFLFFWAVHKEYQMCSIFYVLFSDNELIFRGSPWKNFKSVIDRPTEWMTMVIGKWTLMINLVLTNNERRDHILNCKVEIRLWSSTLIGVKLEFG